MGTMGRAIVGILYKPSDEYLKIDTKRPYGRQGNTLKNQKENIKMKQNYITRTIRLGSYEVMGINLETAEVSTTVSTIPSYQRIKDPVKYFATVMDTPTFKVVFAKLTGATDTLYGMTEEDFIANAVVMKSRINKED